MKTSSPWKKWASEHGRFTINPMPAFGNCAPAPMFTPIAPSCAGQPRSEEHTSELQSLMRISDALFCLKKKKKEIHENNKNRIHNGQFHTPDQLYAHTITIYRPRIPHSPTKNHITINT